MQVAAVESQVVGTYFYFDQFSETYYTLFLLICIFIKFGRFRSLDPSQIASSPAPELENTSLIIILVVTPLFFLLNVGSKTAKGKLISNMTYKSKVRIMLKLTVKNPVHRFFLKG